TDDVAAYAMGVFGDKYGERTKHGVGCGVNMPDQSGIAVAGRSVVAAAGRRQANPVEVLQVGRAEGADFDHLRLPNGGFQPKSLGGWLRSRKGAADNPDLPGSRSACIPCLNC